MMPPGKMLPNLLVIGAAKSGTTSLHYYLGQHPQIHMARPTAAGVDGSNDAAPKEMRFWWRDDWRERLRWYESHFDVDVPVRGEATPGYSAWPFHPDVPERIHQFMPHVKLLYVVRDPVDRIVAHYVQMRVDGDRRALTEWISALEEPANRIVCPSRYATQIERYVSLFEREQLLVVDQHELKHDRASVLDSVFSFLGVGPFDSPAFHRERNTRSEKREFVRGGRSIYTRLLDPAGRHLAPSRWNSMGTRVRRALTRPIDADVTIDEESLRRLQAHLRPEVDRLREITGKSFATWSV